MKQLSKPQLEVLRALVLADKPISRLPGGFWSIEGTPERRPGVPSWFAALQTVQSLEKRGLLERTNRHPEDWHDDRQLTQLGRKAAA